MAVNGRDVKMFGGDYPAVSLNRLTILKYCLLLNTLHTIYNSVKKCRVGNL